MKKSTKQEADYKNKAGTAWSHSYLNQKPWHPLSYPNQRRKWIAEQTQSERQRKAEEVAREFSQEQEFFRQSALLSKKEKEKAEALQALSFMYMRPPGYNAESARAAEIADEVKKQGDADPQLRPEPELPPQRKPRVLDIYGRPVPTEEEFPALKNAPRLETGTVARAKPFGIEIRNVKCARCGMFGHQSGDRECMLKDIIMPNEQARLKRDDPLTIMMSQTEDSKWELKQKLGAMSPPRGGYKPDDPNQQILSEDIYDEYGGFLGDGEGFANMIASFSRDDVISKKRKEKKGKKKKKRRSSESESESSTDSSDSDRDSRKKHRKKGNHRDSRKSKRNSSEDESSRGRSHSRKKRQEEETSGSGMEEAEHSHRKLTEEDGRSHRDDQRSHRERRHEEDESGPGDHRHRSTDRYRKKDEHGDHDDDGGQRSRSRHPHHHRKSSRKPDGSSRDEHHRVKQRS